jgi:hypothetical protein
MGDDWAAEVLAIVAEHEPRLRALGAAAAERRRAPGAWSGKEVLGHLVDSALHNHRRFVEAQLVDALHLPGYAQAEWVRCDAWQSEEWPAIIALWAALNRHLAHVLRHLPDGKLAVPCRIGEAPPVPLRDIVADYLRHLRHHLGQVGTP